MSAAKRPQAAATDGTPTCANAQSAKRPKTSDQPPCRCSGCEETDPASFSGTQRKRQAKGEASFCKSCVERRKPAGVAAAARRVTATSSTRLAAAAAPATGAAAEVEDVHAPETEEQYREAIIQYLRRHGHCKLVTLGEKVRKPACVKKPLGKFVSAIKCKRGGRIGTTLEVEDGVVRMIMNSNY